MPFLGTAIVLVQIILAVHAGKRGHQNWIYIILLVPGIGGAAYFFTHVLPELQGGGSVGETGETIVNTISPSRKLKKLLAQVEFSDTVENRHLLAKEYMRIGAYEEAIPVYESCLEGIFADEPYLIIELAGAYYQKGAFEKAKDQLLKIKENHPRDRYKEAFLLLAMTYESLYEPENATEEYEELVNIFPGEEARCRYALFLKKTGSEEEARDMFKEIIKAGEQSPGYYRRSQKKWLAVARQNLTEPPPPKA
ncbi:MAG: tetratricopeptide repeat protein [bacterium]|nr:tetratricopeptide repeat protein [bacterium]